MKPTKETILEIIYREIQGVDLFRQTGIGPKKRLSENIYIRLINEGLLSHAEYNGEHTPKVSHRNDGSRDNN